MNTENQLIVVDPKEFGLEEAKASEMVNGLTSIISERNELEKIFDELIKQELNEATLKQAKELRLKISNNRTKGIEPWHKANKAFYLNGGRFVDAIKNKEIVNNERMEEKLKEIETYFINLEREQKDKLKEDRLDLLAPYNVDVQFVSIEEMTEEQFNGFLNTNKVAYEAKIEKEKQAELARIEAEKLAEEKRLAELKIEQDRIEAQRLENERLKIEAEKREKEMADEREKLAKEQAEKDRLAKIESDKLAAELAETQRLNKIEAEKQAKIIADAKAEAEKLNAQIKAKEEAEKQQQEQEKARIEAEEAEKLAKEKALASAGDREKVKHFFETFKAISFPELTSENGIKLSNEINEGLYLLKKGIIDGSKNLL